MIKVKQLEWENFDGGASALVGKSDIVIRILSAADELFVVDIGIGDYPYTYDTCKTIKEGIDIANEWYENLILSNIEVTNDD